MWTVSSSADGSRWIHGDGLLNDRQLVALVACLDRVPVTQVAPHAACILDWRQVRVGAIWPRGWQTLVQQVAAMNVAVVLGPSADDLGCFLAWASGTWVSIGRLPTPQSLLARWLAARSTRRDPPNAPFGDRVVTPAVVTRAIRRQQLQQQQPRPLDWGLQSALQRGIQRLRHRPSSPCSLAMALNTLAITPLMAAPSATIAGTVALHTQDVAWIAQLVANGWHVQLAETAVTASAPFAAALRRAYRRDPQAFGRQLQVLAAPDMAAVPVDRRPLMLTLDEQGSGTWQWQGQSQLLQRRRVSATAAQGPSNADLWDCADSPPPLTALIQCSGGQWLPHSAVVFDRLALEYLAAAAQLLDDGAAAGHIDLAAYRLGYRVGPLAWLDDWGASRVEMRAEQLQQPVPRLVALLRADDRRVYRYWAGRRWGVDPHVYRLLQRWPAATVTRDQVQTQLSLAMTHARQRVQRDYSADTVARVLAHSFYR